MTDPRSSDDDITASNLLSPQRHTVLAGNEMSCVITTFVFENAFFVDVNRVPTGFTVANTADTVRFYHEECKQQ